MSSVPIFRLPKDERAEIVRRFVGRRVSIDVDPFRNRGHEHTIEGELLAVASPYWGGAQTHTAVLKMDGKYPVGISLAIIRNIFPG